MFSLQKEDFNSNWLQPLLLSTLAFPLSTFSLVLGETGAAKGILRAQLRGSQVKNTFSLGLMEYLLDFQSFSDIIKLFLVIPV